MTDEHRNPTLWRIDTVWESPEALTAMRASGGTPRGIQIFSRGWCRACHQHTGGGGNSVAV